MSALTYAAFYEHELKKLIEIEIENMKQNMSYGTVSSFEDYRHACGKIAGLRVAIELMAEAEKICNQR